MNINRKTWIESVDSDRLEVRHRSGQLLAAMYLMFGGFAAVLAFVEPGNIRWAAGVLAIINFYVAWTKASLVTIVFDRPAGTVTCGEQRPFLAREAALPLEEFLNAELRPAPRGGGKMQLGMATREGRFIPIDAKIAPDAATDLVQTIDEWLGYGEADTSPDLNPAEDD